MKRKTRTLQLSRSNESREIDFELDFLQSLTTAQRFKWMQRKTRELLRLLRDSGHRRPSQIVQRS